MNKKESNRIHTTLFIEKHAKVYVGRLIGLLNDLEMQGILKKKNIQKKLIRAEGNTLEKLAEVGDNATGLRVLMVVDKVDDKDVEKFLFISEKIESLSYKTINKNPKEVAYQFGKIGNLEDHWLIMTGEDDDN